MNVITTVKPVVTGITVDFTLEEAKIIQELIGPYSVDSMRKELDCEPSYDAARAVCNLYSKIEKIIKENK